MIIESTKTHSIIVKGVPRLDPVHVYITDYEPGQGRITIACWGNAWTTCWMAMSGMCLRDFWLSCDEDYLLKNLLPTDKRQTKHDKEYLARIIEAVTAALWEQVNGQ